MMQKNASPTREQRQIMERHGLKPRWWTVLRNLNHNLIVKNKLTGEIKYLEKQGTASAPLE